MVTTNYEIVEHQTRSMSDTWNSVLAVPALIAGAATIYGGGMAYVLSDDYVTTDRGRKSLWAGLALGGFGGSIMIAGTFERDRVVHTGQHKVEEQRENYAGACPDQPAVGEQIRVGVTRGKERVILTAQTNQDGKATVSLARSRELRMLSGTVTKIVYDSANGSGGSVALRGRDAEYVAAAIARGGRQRPPANLKFAGEFRDDEGNGNGVLDAAESARLRLQLTNVGVGDAEFVRVLVEPDGPAAAHIRVRVVGGEFEVLEAGRTVPIDVQVEADFDLPDGEVKFVLTADEPQFPGSAGLLVKTRKLVPPRLVSYASVDDSQLGGNGNGVVDANELVTLNVTVRNQGRGEARDIRVKLLIPPDAVDIVPNIGEDRIARLGPVGSGQDSRTVALQFSVNSRFQGDVLPIRIQVQEAFGRFGTTDDPKLSFASGGERIMRSEVRRDMGGGASVMLSDVDGPNVPMFAAVQSEQDYAIVIGVERYLSPEVRGVPHAAADARTAADYMEKVLGVTRRNINLLTDEQATRSQIRTAVLKLVRAGKIRNLYVFYAGHGVPDQDAAATPYLLPFDAEPQYLSEAGIKMSEFYGLLGRVEADRVLVMLDSCFSGEQDNAAGRSVMVAGTRPVIPVARQAQVLRSGIPDNTVVLTAAQGSQMAGSYDEKYHGAFSYYVFKGMQGDADLNGDGTVGVAELHSYVQDQVESTARRQDGREQTPDLMGNAKAFDRLFTVSH
jgi:hypothetical protein